MTHTLKKSVLQELERTFAPEHRQYVRSQLADRALPMDHSAPPPRVHIAIIWLSKGDRKRFDTEMNGACCDWRDTLVAAGLANEDWKSVLAKRGIDFSDW